MSADRDPVRPRRECHVRPEDVKKIGGAQSVDDKVETWQRQIEAAESQNDSSTRDTVLFYGAVILSFIVGSFMSGFSTGGGGGGDILIGTLDILGSGVLF